MDRQKAIDIQNRIVLKRMILVESKKLLDNKCIAATFSKRFLEQLLPVVPTNFDQVLKLAIDDVYQEFDHIAQKSGREIHVIIQILS